MVETASLCFEKLGAETILVDAPNTPRAPALSAKDDANIGLCALL
jgi:hypothetical protein